jgi:hypothetical protein
MQPIQKQLLRTQAKSPLGKGGWGDSVKHPLESNFLQIQPPFPPEDWTILSRL